MRPADLRQRRAHEKSRKGCVRCKQQRKKCDEAHPACTRCDRNGHTCVYDAPEVEQADQTAGSTLDVGDQAHDASYLAPNNQGPAHLGLPSPNLSYSSWPDDIRAAESMSADSPSPSHLSMRQLSIHPRGSQQMPAMLSSQELELLSHYITHTSRVVAFDKDDLYALHVGIPNLAFTNRPLMASILALSAACKSHGLLTHSPEPLDKLGALRDLLVLAHWQHAISLREVQTAIHDVDQYTPLLANTALMVLYASSSHCVRVSLAQLAKRHGLKLPDELLPTHSQWITLIRAAYTAYTGLLNGEEDGYSEIAASSSRSYAETPDSDANTPPAAVDDQYLPEDGPSDGTRRFFLPIVSATHETALEALRERAQVPQSDPGIDACSAAVNVLAAVYRQVFDERGSMQVEYEMPQLGRLRGVEPWLRKYLGRVTSASPSKPSKSPLRRTIMAFLNYVPLRFLHLVQSMLDCIPVQDASGDSPETDAHTPPPSVAQLLAMDIFAHWLVLVTLLDGVWWIGGIGDWELGRVVSFIKAQTASGNEYADLGEKWWPDSMENVKNGLQQAM